MATTQRSAAPVRRRRRPALPDDAVTIVQGLRRIVKAIERYSSDVRRTYGLTGPQLWAMKTLLRRGPLSTGELATALAVQSSSLSLLIDRLERRGLVRRVRPRTDRRSCTPANAAVLCLCFCNG